MTACGRGRRPRLQLSTADSAKRGHRGRRPEAPLKNALSLKFLASFRVFRGHNGEPEQEYGIFSQFKFILCGFLPAMNLAGKTSNHRWVLLVRIKVARLQRIVA